MFFVFMCLNLGVKKKSVRSQSAVCIGEKNKNKDCAFGVFLRDSSYQHPEKDARSVQSATNRLSEAKQSNVLLFCLFKCRNITPKQENLTIHYR